MSPLIEVLFNNTFTISRRMRVFDGQGGWSITYAEIGTVEGRMRPAGSAERIAADQESRRLTHVLYVLEGTDIARGDLVEGDDVIVEVLGIREPSRTDYHLEIDCEEKQEEATATTPLPLSIDFTALGDGLLPAPLVGATWAVTGGEAVNTPSLSAEILTADTAGFEGAYAGGVAAGWIFYGVGTPSQSADVHGGAKAQQMIGAAAYDRIQRTQTPVADTWYRFSAWGKRTAGTAGSTRTASWLNGAQDLSGAIDSAAYAERVVTRLVTAVSAMYIRPCIDTSGGGDTVIVDDASLKTIDGSEMFTFTNRRFPTSDAGIRAAMTVANGAKAGLALCWDSGTNPQSGLIAMISQTRCRLWKCVAGTWTELDDKAITYIAGGTLEIAKTGTSIAVKYRGGGALTTQTVTDAEIVGNRWHGMWSSDPGSTFDSLYVDYSAAFNGSILFMFDDANDTDYTEAFAYMNAHSLPGSCFIVSGRVGIPPHLTTVQTDEMYAAGWDMANHTETAPDLTTLTQVQQEAEIGNCRDDLDGWGYTRAADIVRYPGGGANADTYLAMAAQSMWGELPLHDVTYAPPGLWVANPSSITEYDHTIVEILAALEEAIVTNKRNFDSHWHTLTGDSLTKFKAVVDYVVAHGYDTMTVSEWAAQAT